jgi:hypothetical protein
MLEPPFAALAFGTVEFEASTVPFIGVTGTVGFWALAVGMVPVEVVRLATLCCTVLLPTGLTSAAALVLVLEVLTRGRFTLGSGSGASSWSRSSLVLLVLVEVVYKDAGES